jgi:phosphate:Na+ symporter
LIGAKDATGLVTFSQAVGVIIGATFGTTSTPWLVAIFGFRLRISAFALPMLGIGAFLWLIAKGRTRSAGAILAGFGLLFIGIEYLQTGMEGISWNLDAVGGSGSGWQWILAGIGILMSIVMQSSSAAAATTLVALHAGSLTFDQACAMIVGQSVGTAATSALVAIGAGLAVRRAALAHIVYNVTIGIIGILLLGPIAAAAHWVGAQFDDPDGVLALAAFQQHLQVRRDSRILSVARWLLAVDYQDLRDGQRVGGRPSRSGPRRSGRGCRARSRLARNP